MPFQDLAAFIAPGFDLPIGGKMYHVPPPSARDGLWLQALMDGVESIIVAQAITKANKAVLSDDQERTAYHIALGSAHSEMVADDVPWPALKAAGMTAILYWTRNPEAAERYWASQGKARAAGPEEATSPTGGATSPEGPSTRSPA